MSLIWSVVTICGTMLGLGAIAWYLGRVQMEARWARRREAEAERNARLQLEQKVTAERMRAAEEAARRKAMDQFLSEIRTEERAYLRQREVGASLTRSVVVEERLYFRNVPVSNWTQQELTFYTASGEFDVSKMLPRGAA
jgi:hypothetical protein